ncbi:MAG: hypothetical protein V3R66_03320 [Rhodospirillales bacterium]
MAGRKTDQRKESDRRFGRGTRSGFERRLDNSQWKALEKRQSKDRRGDKPRRQDVDRRREPGRDG